MRLAQSPRGMVRAEATASQRQHSSRRGSAPSSSVAGPARVRRVRGGRGGALRCRALFGGWNPLKTDPAEATRKQYQPTLEACKQFASSYASATDDELRGMTESLRDRVRAGAALDSLLPEAFAVVAEASHRVLGLRPYDVQLIGGMVLNDGKVAEMKTGEGKTLVAVLPAFLNALGGLGVHVVTVNDYLAKRDAEWVGQVHRFLGLTVGIIQQDMKPAERRAAYAKDVTYVTNSELGFDYLRDNLANEPEELVLREFNFCVIDEVDSILIDEARTPLIISGEAEPAGVKYATAAKIAEAFERDVHYTVQEKEQSANLTEEGFESCETVLQVTDLYDPREQWATYIINAILAKELKIRDKHYILKGGEIIIVDEFTGRTMPGRRWNRGLHQAIEAKEGVKIQKETTTVGSISYQNFFSTFPKLAGMTGTAATEVKEFGDIYNLAVDVVPTNKETIRRDNSDVVFKTEEYKWAAVRKEIEYMHNLGRPILIGTTTVDMSEELSADLVDMGINHRVLNAKPENVQKESETVAQAGRKGAVTIATNMAGRGTDILLGGNPEFMARLKIREHLFAPLLHLEEYDDVAFEPGKKQPQKEIERKLGKWKCDPDLFPCGLGQAAEQAIRDAVDAAKEAYGGRSMTELQLEEMLATGCEKTPTDDGVIMKIRDAFLKTSACYESVTSVERTEVVGLGGLHVIGTERHDSRRVDNQLRGRSGRQGDPGSTRFFLSLSDRLFRIFGGDRVKGIMEAFGLEDVPLESDMVSKSIDDAQKKVEQYQYDARKSMYDYDKVLNLQRTKLYEERLRHLLSDKEQLEATMEDFASRTMDDIVDYHLPEDAPITQEALANLCSKVMEYCDFMSDLDPDSIVPTAEAWASSGAARVDGDEGESSSSGRTAIASYLKHRAVEAVHSKAVGIDKLVHEGSAHPDDMNMVQEAMRHFCLLHLDDTWKKVLQAMEFLQTSVRLRGYAQKDPLIEYKLQGFTVFAESMSQARRNIVYSWYKFDTEKVLAWRETQRRARSGGDPSMAALEDSEAAAADESAANGGGTKSKGRRKKKQAISASTAAA